MIRYNNTPRSSGSFRHSQSVGPQKSTGGAVYKSVEKFSQIPTFLYITLLSPDHVWKDTGDAKQKRKQDFSSFFSLINRKKKVV